MKRMIKFPSINQFRQVVKEVTERACYIGKDDEGKAVFDYLKPKPTLTFTISTKLHGTNAAFCYSEQDSYWTQSRENILTLEKDNMGFAWFCEQNKETLISIIKELALENNIDLNKYIISLYGEFCGSNIQKGVAITGLDKMFVIFEHFKVFPIEPTEDEKSVWVRTISDLDAGVSEGCTDFKTYYNWAESPENKIFNIMNFPTKSISIDFNNPERAQNELLKIMEEVEAECPVGKAFGVSGVGEGVVCTYLTADGALTMFKVKGEKHSSSRVKTSLPVDTEKLNKIDKCIEKICHTWRFAQALREIFGPDYEKTLDRSKIGEYIKWVNSDTLKEELDVIAEFGFEPKDVMGKVSQKAKEYFFAVENSNS